MASRVSAEDVAEIVSWVTEGLVIMVLMVALVNETGVLMAELWQ